ncbi:MAG: hypothetical protein AB1611_12620 [bacterium]
MKPMKHTDGLFNNCKITIEEWQNELEGDNIGKKIVKNFKEETNLDRKGFLSFYARVCKMYPDRASRNLNAQTIIEYCADHKYANPSPKPLTLRGPKIDPSNDEKLYRLESARKFFKQFTEKGHVPYNRYTWFLSKIKEKQLDKDDLKGKFIGNERGIVWCTWEKSAIEAEKQGDTLDDLRDRLGLSHLNGGEELIRVIYDWKVIDGLKSGLRVPTVLDAGSTPYFKPGGWTMSLTRKKEGLPEMVHEKIPMDSVDIDYKGKLTKSAPRRF